MPAATSAAKNTAPIAMPAIWPGRRPLLPPLAVTEVEDEGAEDENAEVEAVLVIEEVDDVVIVLLYIFIRKAPPQTSCALPEQG